jgi:DNA polymerase-1
MAALPRRVHTTLVQVGGATGRINSVNPNLQNIPAHVHSKHAAAFRAAFNRPAPGYVLVSADYSQVSNVTRVVLSAAAAMIKHETAGAWQQMHRQVQGFHAAAHSLYISPDQAQQWQVTQLKLYTLCVS